MILAVLSFLTYLDNFFYMQFKDLPWCFLCWWNLSTEGNYSTINLYFPYFFEEHKHIKFVIVWDNSVKNIEGKCTFIKKGRHFYNKGIALF